MSSPRTFRMNDWSAGTCVPHAKTNLMSSVFGSIRLISCLMKGDCLRVESVRIIAGLQLFSVSNGRAPMGLDRASLKAKSAGLLGSGFAWTYRILSGVRSMLPPNSSKTERLIVVVKEGYEWDGQNGDLSID